MKKILSVIVTAALIFTLFSGSAYAGQGNGNGNSNGSGRDKLKEFKDMKGHWGKISVEKMQSRGILGGYSDDTFQPDRTLTQGELAVIIARMIEAKQSGDDDMEDEDWDSDDGDELSKVPEWAKDAVWKGFQKKYLNMKRFHSHVQCDRLTAVVAIAKALDLEPVTDFSVNPFKDRGLISDEDFGYLLALYQAGYIKGYPDGNFNPNRLLTRAQIAIIIDKLLDDEDEISEDNSAPTWDGDSVITAAALSASTVKLKWSAAEDDVKVTGYKVLYEINGTDKVKHTDERSIAITGLNPDEEYQFTVEARDAAGNWSDDGPSVEVTMPEEEDEQDDTAPAWPGGADLTISSSVSGIITIIWPDAQDDAGVDAYKLYQDGKLIKSLGGDVNSVNVTGLDSDTEYTFKLKAVNEAGNQSDSLTKTYLTD